MRYIEHYTEYKGKASTARINMPAGLAGAAGAVCMIDY